MKSDNNACAFTAVFRAVVFMKEGRNKKEYRRGIFLLLERKKEQCTPFGIYATPSVCIVPSFFQEEGIYKPQHPSQRKTNLFPDVSRAISQLRPRINHIVPATEVPHIQC
ncbi:hypothetical protein NQ317_017453 [Molorchus minor]|uniref:Uncharacterized protein n=1 Tax=Molorchus minor TaxID=1323400 RepID=A0ABQ9J517_9CUCU|nr:hypothetical protein NQ317_017453 [Molorchus minor]